MKQIMSSLPARHTSKKISFSDNNIKRIYTFQKEIYNRKKHSVPIKPVDRADVAEQDFEMPLADLALGFGSDSFHVTLATYADLIYNPPYPVCRFKQSPPEAASLMSQICINS